MNHTTPIVLTFSSYRRKLKQRYNIVIQSLLNSCCCSFLTPYTVLAFQLTANVKTNRRGSFLNFVLNYIAGLQFLRYFSSFFSLKTNPIIKVKTFKEGHRKECNTKSGPSELGLTKEQKQRLQDFCLLKLQQNELLKASFYLIQRHTNNFSNTSTH